MKPEKAIETLKDILKYVVPGDPPEEHEAIQLGIEALKRVQKKRSGLYYSEVGLLPSETKE